jgi:hypothetical protein
MTPNCILSLFVAASIAADQNASVDTAYFDQTKAALGTSTLWAKAITHGPLTW